MEREEHLFEALCKKGKAYAARRKAAGEKHGAYLMGRAVKVCKGQMKSEGEESGQVNVFGYQTQHFDVCPGAQSLYKRIEDENLAEDKDLVIRVAKLQDSLFYIEKVAKEGGIDVTPELIDTAQNMADLIMSGAEKMKLEKEHNYIQGHVDTIKDLAKDKTADEEVYEIDALHENEEYCPKCAAKIKEAIREEIEKVAKEDYKPSLRGYNVIDKSNNDEIVAKELSYDRALEKAHTNPNYKIKATQRLAKEAKTKPAKGKRFAKKVKNPKTGRTRTVSYGQAGKAKKGGDRIRPGTAKGNAYCARSAKIKKCKNPPCANTLSRKKWKCQGSRSVK